MKDFKKGGYGADRGGSRFGGGDRGGRPSFGGNSRGFGGGRDMDRPREMHRATCGECGKSCEVPFRPTGEKPVYCLDCFGGKESAPSRSFDNKRESFSRPAPSFAPRPAPSAPDGRIDDIKRQMETIASKLDKLIDAVHASIKPAAPAVAVKSAPEKISKPVAAKAPKAEAPAKAEKKTPKAAPKKAAPKKK